MENTKRLNDFRDEFGMKWFGFTDKGAKTYMDVVADIKKDHSFLIEGSKLILTSMNRKTDNINVLGMANLILLVEDFNYSGYSKDNIKGVSYIEFKRYMSLLDSPEFNKHILPDLLSSDDYHFVTLSGVKTRTLTAIQADLNYRKSIINDPEGFNARTRDLVDMTKHKWTSKIKDNKKVTRMLKEINRLLDIRFSITKSDVIVDFMKKQCSLYGPSHFIDLRAEFEQKLTKIVKKGKLNKKDTKGLTAPVVNELYNIANEIKAA